MYVVCLTTDTDIEAIEENEVYRCFDVSNGICTSKYGKGIIENIEEYRNIIKTGSISYITRDLVDKFECIDSNQGGTISIHSLLCRRWSFCKQVHARKRFSISKKWELIRGI